MRYIVFAIDKGNDLHTKAKFLREVDTLKASQKLKGHVKMCIGSYEGVLEDSFICTEEDFEYFKLYTSLQECVMEVEQGYKGVMYAALKYRNGDTQNLGVVREITKEEAMKKSAWTYRPDLNRYYAASC